MDRAETPRACPPQQLPLPLPATPPAGGTTAPPLAVAPPQLWATLLPAERVRVRTTLVRVLREVVDEP